MRCLSYVGILLCGSLLAAPVQGQEDPDRFLYAFDIQPHATSGLVNINERLVVPVTVTDYSRDSTAGAAGQPGPGVRSHTTTWQIEYLSNAAGWTVLPPPAVQTLGGQTATVDMFVEARQNVREPQLDFSLTALTQTLAGTFETQLNFSFLTFGPNVYNAQAVGSLQIRPGEVDSQIVRVTNGQFFPREFAFEVAGNDCDLTVAHDGTFVVMGRTSDDIPLTVRGPTGKFWYNSELCQINVAVFPLDQEGNRRALPLSVQVQGTYVNPLWVFWGLAGAVAIFLLVVFVHRRKAVIEEELLGKPQRPWTIPVERVYLQHLETADARAAYVVRHFLMEEEYQSALLWYKNYKQATRGERQKESLVVTQEKRYDRFRRDWAKRIAAPMKQADRFESRVQKRLDRKAKRRVRKERRAWKKLVAKLENATESQNAKALAKWEKSAAKAEKKGHPVPPKPELATPDLPPEPQLEKILLADHKWNKKATKFRKKMVKRQGDLEVKFEKKDARMLHKLRKKVHKIARKLDDPEFVNEHPLLAGEA